MVDKPEVKENKVTEYSYKPLLVVDEAEVTLDKINKPNARFKGEVEQKKVRFPKELGEEHPFDFSTCEGIYKRFGFVTGVIDKFIDFVIGPGFYVECEKERAKEIIEQFMKDINFDTLLRSWIKEALVKGNGFLEIGGKKDESPKGLKILDAKYMYVDRDEKGVIIGYNQYTGSFKRFDKTKMIHFETYQIAHLAFNGIGDMPYGLGIVAPGLVTINSLLQNKKNLNMLMDRKANSPYHVKMGGVVGGKYYKPSAADVEKMGRDFEWLNNKHEWITDGLTDINVLDFGNMGDKFQFVLEHDEQTLFYTFQVPAVLMGAARIPEGIAKVQMDAFERRVSSIQAEIEKVIETNLFKRVLISNGFDVHVEFEWGRPSSMEKFNRLEKISSLSKSPMTSDSLRKLIEKDIVKLLNYNEEEFEEMKEEEELEKEREKEELRNQPIVPGQNANKPQFPPKEKPKQPKPAPPTKQKTYHLPPDNYLAECPHCADIKEGQYSEIQEWLGFNYKKYLGEILTSIKGETFEDLRAKTKIEEKAGKLSEKQLIALKEVLDDGFSKGKNIKEISKAIDRKVKPGDLLKMSAGKIILGVGGIAIVSRGKEHRAISIARSEITRVANKGAIEHFKKGGVTNFRWVASWGVRTCPDCESLDGQIFTEGNLPPLPFHAMCRCTTIPISEVV